MFPPYSAGGISTTIKPVRKIKKRVILIKKKKKITQHNIEPLLFTNKIKIPSIGQLNIPKPAAHMINIQKNENVKEINNKNPSEANISKFQFILPQLGKVILSTQECQDTNSNNMTDKANLL